MLSLTQQQAIQRAQDEKNAQKVFDQEFMAAFLSTSMTDDEDTTIAIPSTEENPYTEELEIQIIECASISTPSTSSIDEPIAVELSSNETEEEIPEIPVSNEQDEIPEKVLQRKKLIETTPNCKRSYPDIFGDEQYSRETEDENDDSEVEDSEEIGPTISLTNTDTFIVESDRSTEDEGDSDDAAFIADDYSDDDADDQNVYRQSICPSSDSDDQSQLNRISDLFKKKYYRFLL